MEMLVRVHKPLLALVVCCLLSPAFAGQVEDCDRLAGEPAVAIADIAPEGEAACLAALDLDDASPRLMHQYARTLERAGKPEAALRYFGWAADDGYPPARAALERLGAKTREAGTPAVNPLTQYAGEVADVPALMTAFGRDFDLLLHGAALHEPETVFAQRHAGAPDLARLAKALILAQDPLAETRFGLCTLTKDASSAIITPVLARAVSAPSVLERLETAAKATDTPDEVRSGIEHLATTWRESIAEGKAEAAALAANIRSATTGFRTQTSDEAAQEFARVPYVLVEWRDGGSWTTFDPSSGTVFDTAACATYETMADLPAELALRLHIKLFADEADGSEAPAERLVLDQEVPFGSAATLVFAESFAMSPPDTQHERGAQEYTPALLADGKRFYGTAIRLPRAPSAEPEFGEVLSSKLGGVADALEADDTPPSSTGPTIPDRIRGLRLLMTLVDFKGEGETQALTLLNRPDAATPMPDALGHYLPFMQIVALTPLDGIGAPLRPAPDLAISESGLVAQVQAAGNAMAGFERLRRAILTDLSAVPGYAPLPRAVGLMVTVYEAKAKAPGVQVPDLTLRNHMVRPHEPSVAADPIAAAADWAVASVLAERLSLTLSLDKDAAPVPFDAVSVWTAARKAGAVKIINAPDDLASLSDGAKARAAARLARGQVLLAPKTALSRETEKDLAWWAIDPALGTVEDEFANGGRQTLPEDAKVRKEVACQTAPFQISLAMRVRRVIYTVGFVLALGSAVTGGGGEITKAVVKGATAMAKDEAENEKRRRATELANKAAGKAVCGK
jgi:hypothetical protein